MVLNDLASAYVLSKQYKEGIERYEEAVTRAESMEDMKDSLVAFHYNLGEVSCSAILWNTGWTQFGLYHCLFNIFWGLSSSHFF